jgi:hypothetical protein
MDDLDRLLVQLPGEQPPPGLTHRVRRDFHKRYRRFRLIRITASSLMVILGTWLLLPWLLVTAGGWNFEVDGISLLQSLTLTPEPIRIVNATWQGASTMQINLSTSIGLFNWLGLVAVGAGSFIGLSALLPGHQVG